MILIPSAPSSSSSRRTASRTPVDAVGLATEEMAVALGLGHRSAADQEPRSERATLGDGITDRVGDHPALTAVVGGRDPGTDHPLRGDRATDDEIVIGLDAEGSQRVDGRRQRQVDVGIHQPGQGGRVGKVQRARVLGPVDARLGPTCTIRSSTTSRAPSSTAGASVPSINRPTRILECSTRTRLDAHRCLPGRYVAGCVATPGVGPTWSAAPRPPRRRRGSRPTAAAPASRRRSGRPRTGPVLRSATGCSGGSSVAQTSGLPRRSRSQQRVWKRQPAAGSRGSGCRP